MPRRLRNVLDLPDQDRFSVLAEGMERLAVSVATLDTDLGKLARSRRFQSAGVLRCFADEEAAKILILLDVVRVGWEQQAEVIKLMKWFYQHLARGLYIQAYDGHPADLAEIRRYVDALRPAFYLDGPDVDWIFRNEVMASREERLYVDYISEEDGSGHWIGPADRAEMTDEPFRFPAPTSYAVRLVIAMRRIGLLTSNGLETVRKVWDGVTIDDTTHWTDFRPLNGAVIDGLGIPSTKDNLEAVRVVLDHWIFPLHTLDLSLENVPIEDLQKIRDQWLP